ncbi:MAG: HD domain-containing protein, partial [Defluviitaleaceae bacterium]|nr:HD domain-containing protein [Defluviitaleaceae bacterium]
MQNDKLVLFEDCAEDMLFEQLISKVSAYHPARDFSLIERAYALARDAHQGQERKSGEPYIQHPLEVAIMLANPLRADRETIAAGILHDVIEDTDYTYEDLKEIF